MVRVCFSENTAAAIPGVTKAPISLGSSLSKFNKKIESSYKHESFNSGAKHSTFSLATNHDTITALSDYSLTKEIASRRIEAISRELSVIESSLRNRTELSAEHLPVLDSILTLLYEHRRETAVGSSDISNRFMALNSNQTFYQRPTLAAAVKIIVSFKIQPENLTHV